MTETQPMAPTDTEIDALWVGQQLTVPQLVQRRTIARAVLAKWGPQPLRYNQPPTLFTVFAKCDEYEGEVPLAQYSATSEYGVLDRVMGDARNAGYTGHAKDRMTELGWRIVPVYATPQPVARKPMTHDEAKTLVAKYGNDPLHLVLQVERHHGIKGGQHGTE